MDDASIEGTKETVFRDLRTLKTRWGEISLKINDTKYGVTLLNHASEDSVQTMRAFTDILPRIKNVPREGCSLLETPLFPEVVPVALQKKADDLDLMINCLQRIHPHQALVLLKNYFSIPKL